MISAAWKNFIFALKCQKCYLWSEEENERPEIFFKFTCEFFREIFRNHARFRCHYGWWGKTTKNYAI